MVNRKGLDIFMTCFGIAILKYLEKEILSSEDTNILMTLQKPYLVVDEVLSIAFDIYKQNNKGKTLFELMK